MSITVQNGPQPLSATTDTPMAEAPANNRAFDFMGLPLELRTKFYALTLLPSNGKIWRHRNDDDVENSDLYKVDISILLTSRQVSREARDILHRRAECHIAVTKKQTTGYQFDQPDQLAICKFRHVVLEAYIIKPVNYSETGTTTLAYAFHQLLPILRLYNETTSDLSPKQLDVHFANCYKESKWEYGQQTLLAEMVEFINAFAHDLRAVAPGRVVLELDDRTVLLK